VLVFLLYTYYAVVAGGMIFLGSWVASRPGD
jgi:hypothetical protein